MSAKIKKTEKHQKNNLKMNSKTYENVTEIYKRLIY